MLEENHARARDFRLTLVFGFAALLIGLWSVPASLWEWDEVLFARGLHDYDIPTHSPHPPGFPLYIFLGRAALLLGVDDKTALCLVGLLFAFILGAASYRFFRELFEDRRTASAATAFLLAVPPVAIYSGAPRSDVPGLAAGLLVLALAMMGRASPRALAAAGLTLGLGFGVRVTILFAAAPVLIVVSLGWLVRRKWKPVVTAAGLALFGALLCYIPVVLTTGFDEYRRVMQAHTRYTSTIDTFLAPGLNSLWDYRLGRYFLDPWGAPLAAVFIGFCAMAGIVFLILRKRGWVLGWLALAFLPIMLFTVLYMTPLAAPLYVLPFMPLFTGLAAAGLVPPRLRSLPSSRPSPIAVGGFV
ncbi:MAG: glycosyltransferase family 39 protein, partial [Candidatus Aminicenantes bacterium]|nr:glycosyltransferase family 39 protein [Candidatus Aminicenantes bacterium]